MSGLSWYPRYTGDYARKTQHLSLIEHGAYTLLLDYYYATGKPLLFSSATGNAELMPDHSRLYRLCNALGGDEQKAVDTVLDMFFVWDSERGYIHERADETIEDQRVRHEKKVEAGKRGAAAKASKANSKSTSTAKAQPKHSSSTALPNHNHNHIDIFYRIYLIGEKKLNGEMLFESFWNAYPDYGGEGKKASAFKGRKQNARNAFQRILKEKGESYDYENIISGATVYSQFCEGTNTRCCHASTWLNDCGWENSYSFSQASHRLQSGASGRESAGSLSATITAAEEAKKMLR